MGLIEKLLGWGSQKGGVTFARIESAQTSALAKSGLLV